MLGLLNIALFFALLFVGASRLPGGVAVVAGVVQPLVVAGLAATANPSAQEAARTASGMVNGSHVSRHVKRRHPATIPVRRR